MAAEVRYIHEARNQTTKELYEGFSDRLHELIDMMEDLEIPPRERRPKWLADHIGTRNSTTWPWLNNDHPPKDANKDPDSDTPTLQTLAAFLLSHIPGGDDVNPKRLIGYLRYGDTFRLPFLKNDRSYLAMAHQLIIEESQDLEASDSGKFSFSQLVVDKTVQLLKMTEIDQLEDVSPELRETVRLFIDYSLK